MNTYKIVYLITNCKKTGPMNQTLNIIRNLDKDKFTPIIITIFPECENNSMIDSYKEICKEVYCLNMNKFSSILYGRKKLKVLLEEIKPDLIIESRNDKNDTEELNIEEKEEVENDESDDRFTIFENIINKKEENQMKESTDLFLQTDEKIEKVSSDNTSVQTMNSIFNNFDNNDEKYVSYYVHIVRESDNIDTICLKYGVSIDMIKEYNNIDQITLGNKIIIPYIENETI